MRGWERVASGKTAHAPTKETLNYLGHITQIDSG